MNNYQELPVQMHPRYNEFLEFMRECPHRKTPEIMQTAFWVWIESQKKCFFCDRPDPRDEYIASLKADLERLHRERDNFHLQCSAMAEENHMLEQRIKHIESILDFGSVGERGEACLSIDGGNL